MKIKKSMIAALLLTVFMPEAGAQSIRTIKIDGSKRVDPAVIQSYLRSKIGDAYDSQLVNSDLKNLFATGLFSSLSFSFENDVLVIRVVENPILNEIAFEGMSALPEEVVKRELHLESRQVFKKADVIKAVDILLQMYRAKGYFNVRIIPQIIKRPQNRLDLVFKIEEGALTTISKINLVGNKYFEDIDLKSTVDSEETGVFSFFQTSNVYDPNRIRVDEEKLRRFYLKNGFYDFKVKRSTAELLPNYDGFHITYQLEEGAQYTIADIKIQNPFSSLDSNLILQQIPYAVGSIFNQESIEESIDALNDYYAAQGYPFVQITPEIQKNKTDKTITINYNVLKAQKVFIEKIIIEGNHLTREHVIRNQLMISEGDPFNPVLIRKSLKNIRNLGLFEPHIATDKRQGSASDKVMLVLRVSERPFFSIMGGVSYGQKLGFAGNASVSHRNILGTGVATQLQSIFGANTKSLNLNVLNPSISRNIDLSVQTSLKSDQDEKYSAYKEFSYLTSPTLTFHLTENLRTAWDYTFKRYETDFFHEKKRFEHNQQFADRQEDCYKSATSLSVIYDTRDDRFNPTEGMKAASSVEYAGLLGNVDYVKLDITGDYYIPLGRSGMVLAFKGAFGKMWEVHEHYINFFERYRLGSLSFRGFEVSGIGPREQGSALKSEQGAKNQFASNGLGGLNMYKATAEFSFPFAPDVGIRAITFLDVGSVWGLGTPKTQEDQKVGIYKDYNTMKTRVSIGVGIQVDIPFMGRLIAGIAKPLVKEAYDREDVFFFTLGGGL